MYIGIGLAISLPNLLFDKKLDPFVLAFFLLAAAIEVVAKRQKKVPSILISFFVSLAIVTFLKTNVIDIKKLQNQSLEPYINKGAVLFYQPNFYKIENNDLIIIREYLGSKNLLCKVLSINEQSYKLEILSRKITIDVSKDDVEGKIVYITNNNPVAK